MYTCLIKSTPQSFVFKNTKLDSRSALIFYLHRLCSVCEVRNILYMNHPKHKPHSSSSYSASHLLFKLFLRNGLSWCWAYWTTVSLNFCWYWSLVLQSCPFRQSFFIHLFVWPSTKPTWHRMIFSMYYGNTNHKQQQHNGGRSGFTSALLRFSSWPLSNNLNSLQAASSLCKWKQYFVSPRLSVSSIWLIRSLASQALSVQAGLCAMGCLIL